MNTNLFEPVLSTSRSSCSRPKGKRSRRIREEVELSRLVADDVVIVDNSAIGNGHSYLSRGQKQHEQEHEHEQEQNKLQVTATIGLEESEVECLSATSESNEDRKINFFEESRLTADIKLVMPIMPLLPEPEMIGPYVHFRQISERDQDECKLRRSVEKHGTHMRSMTKACEIEKEENGDSYHDLSPSHKDNHHDNNSHDSNYLTKIKKREQSSSHMGGYYKLIANSGKLVMDVLESHGFKRLSGNSLPGTVSNNKPIHASTMEYSVLWSGKHLPTSFYRSILSPHQRVNMFPSSFECTKKDALSRNLNRMAQIHGKRHFKFMTESYTLPREREDLIQAMCSAPGTWIVKPAGSSQGKGIYIIEGATVASPAVSPSGSVGTNYGRGQGQGQGQGLTHSIKRRNRSHQRPRALPLVELTRQLPDCTKAKDNFVVERYIDSPYLIDSRKFDLRIYCVVTSFDPLKIYVHKEGLIRLASVEYSTSTGSYRDQYSHLTNYSINKKKVNPSCASHVLSHNNESSKSKQSEDEPGVKSDSEDNGDSKVHIKCDHDSEQGRRGGQSQEKGMKEEVVGIKLRLSELRARMGISEVEEADLWIKIEDLIIKTFISVESKICLAVRSHCPIPEASFQMFGFDVLIDSELNPWLMEVNFAPSLATDTPLDFEVKSTVLADTFTLCGVRKMPFTKAGVNSGKRVYGGGAGKASGGNNLKPSRGSNNNATTTNTSNSTLSPGCWESLEKEMKPGGNGDVAEGSVITFPVSEKERKVIYTFQRECHRCRATGYRLIYPPYGPTAASYLNFLEEGKEAATLLSHYTFFLRANPSMALTEDTSDRDQDLRDNRDRKKPGFIKAGDLPSGNFTPSTLRRITEEQIKNAREEVRKQESAWKKATLAMASYRDI